MEKISKRDVRDIAKNSDWSSEHIKVFLSLYIYPNNKQWITFLSLFTLIIGVGLFAIGVVFFFAYNWSELHKYTKLILIFSLTIVFILPNYFSKIKLLVKQIFTTAACLMIGVLFAVYGQIYQTGANAYDFFLAWSIFGFIWVIGANFRPLWLLYLILNNTVIYFYLEQNGHITDVRLLTNSLYFFVLNSIPVAIEWFFSKKSKSNYVSYLTFFAIAFNAIIATNVLAFNILGLLHFEWASLYSIFILLSIVYFLMFYKNVFFATLLALSTLTLLITFISLLVEFNIGIFLIITLVIIGYITLSVLAIIALQKRWKNEFAQQN